MCPQIVGNKDYHSVWLEQQALWLYQNPEVHVVYICALERSPVLLTKHSVYTVQGAITI